MRKPSLQKGIGLVEVLIAVSIIVVGIISLISAFTIYVKFANANSGNVQAAYLLEEGMEVMTFFRDNGWTANISKLSTTTTYYLTFSGSTWATTTSAQYVDTIFLRKINLSDVQRNGSGTLVTSGGTYDPNTKLVTVTVDYTQNHATTSRSISSYITNYRSD